MNQSLLDIIAEEMGCKVLSDLHFLTDSQRKRLHSYLESISRSSDFPKDEWNDALIYIKARQDRIDIIPL